MVTENQALSDRLRTSLANRFSINYHISKEDDGSLRRLLQIIDMYMPEVQATEEPKKEEAGGAATETGDETI